MNTKTARLLRKYCTEHNKNLKKAKLQWSRLPWDKREEARKEMTRLLAD